MFALIFDGIGVGEWFVLLAVILIVVGPRRLPSTARKFGQYYAKFRRAAESFRRQIMDMDTEFTSSIREAAAEMEKAADEVENAANDALDMQDGRQEEVQDFTSPASLGMEEGPEAGPVPPDGAAVNGTQKESQASDGGPVEGKGGN